MTDNETYEKVAQEALASTRDAWVRWRDPECGKTVAVGMGGEMSDALAMSNLHAALRILDAHVQTGDVTEDTVGRSGRTWLKVLSFRVYDEDGNITQAWRDAVDNVFLPLRDYAVLDEEDWSEREFTLFTEEMEFIFGAAHGKVIDAMAEAGLPLNIEEFREDYALESVEEALADGRFTLTDDEAMEFTHTARQYCARHDGEGLPRLTARIAELEAE